MNNKTLLIGALALTAIVGLMLWGKSAAQNGPVQPGIGGVARASALTLPEKQYDFGTISMKGGNVEKTFTVTNPTQSPITITSISTSCMCTTAYLSAPSGEAGPFGMPGHGGPSRAVRETLAPGATRSLRVVFDPNAHGPAGVGRIDRVVFVADDTGAESQVEIRANVTP